MKEPVIEFIDYNFLISLLDYFYDFFNNKKVNNKTLEVVQSFSDKHMGYVSPSFSVELLNRKNRAIGFGSFAYELEENKNIIEFEGALLEYNVQLNVYSNTRGEIHKWCSLLDTALKNAESGIDINIYKDNGSIKESSLGIATFSYDSDVKSNNLIPNVVTYDFHSIYDVKMKVVQLFKTTFDIAYLGDIRGELK